MSGDVEVEVGKMTIGSDSDPSEVMSRIKEALEGAFGSEGDSTEKPRKRGAVDHGEALGLLGDLFARYTKSYGVVSVPGCPYKPGDIVTPQGSAVMTSLGEPHIVLETREAEPDWENSENGPSSNSFGCRRDMRVAVIVTGNRSGRLGAVVHWVESFEFLPYEPK